jgi:hypothetical protein
MLNGAEEDLKLTHPRIYYDDGPYRSLFNILLGFFLFGGLILNSAFSSRSILQTALGTFFVAFIAFAMAPTLRKFISQRRHMHEIKTMNKYKKLARDIRNDNWEDEVIAKSRIARILNTIVWSIAVFSIFVGGALVYYTVYSWSFLYLTMSIFVFLSAYTTIHYRISTKGERIQDLIKIFKNEKLTASEIRRYTNLALIFLGIVLSLLFMAIYALHATKLERTILTFGAFEITNVVILTLFSVVMLILIIYFGMYLHGRFVLSEEYDRNKRALQVMMLSIGIVTVVTLSIIMIELMTAVTAAIFSSIVTILFLFLFFKALRNM